MLGLRSWQAILREAEGECPEQAQRVEGHAVVFGLGECGPRDARPSLMASHSDARPKANALSKRSASKGTRWFSGLVIAGLAMLGLRSWQAILTRGPRRIP